MYPMNLHINLALIFGIEIHAKSFINLAYGSHLVYEIIILIQQYISLIIFSI